jgi:hypothetical protein
MSSGQSTTRATFQLSLSQLLVVVTLVGVVLGVYRIGGVQAFIHYGFLVFAVGPWFAHLVSECLPVRSRGLRMLVANLILALLFFATLRLADGMVSGPSLLMVGLVALMLWTPQYLLFLVWRHPEPQDC